MIVQAIARPPQTPHSACRSGQKERQKLFALHNTGQRGGEGQPVAIHIDSILPFAAFHNRHDICCSRPTAC